MATQANKQTAKIKVPSEVLKDNQKEVDKQRTAEEAVLSDPFLRGLYSKDKKRQTTTHKGTIDLWWDRGDDVLSIRRKSHEEEDGGAGDEDGAARAKYGSKAVTLLATALGLDVRVFHRAADFVLLFDEKAAAREKFFAKLSKDHGPDSVPSWTHVDEMLKAVIPTHKDRSDEVFTDLLTTVAREKLSVRAFKAMLAKRFKNGRSAKRKLGAREAIRQLDASLSRAIEAVGPAFTLAAETVGDDYAELVDPQAVREALLAILTRVSDFSRVMADGEQALITRAEGLRVYIATLPAAAQAETPEAGPEPAVPPVESGVGQDPGTPAPATPAPEPSVAA